MRKFAFPQVGAEPEGAPPALTSFAWLSIAAAVTTIALKSSAYLLTGSVGLLSDAAESTVNLVAAVVALIALTSGAQTMAAPKAAACMGLMRIGFRRPALRLRPPAP